MTRAQLIAVAATLSALAAGTIVLVRGSSGVVDPALDVPGNTVWQMLDRSTCSTAACNAAQCVQVTNILVDAGSSCVPRFADCVWRVPARARDLAIDAGIALDPTRAYQYLRVVALRCPVTGGFTFGVPFDDQGLPLFMAAISRPTAPCARAPLDGGTSCLRLLPDAGTRFFGTGNVFPAAEVAGAACEPVAAGCAGAPGVVFGDDPDTTL